MIVIIFYFLFLNRLLKGRSFPGKVLITRRSNPLDLSSLHSPGIDRSPSDHDTGPNESMDDSVEVVLIINLQLWLTDIYYLT